MSWLIQDIRDGERRALTETIGKQGTFQTGKILGPFATLGKGRSPGMTG
jgi:hypothetical protein